MSEYSFVLRVAAIPVTSSCDKGESMESYNWEKKAKYAISTSCNSTKMNSDVIWSQALCGSEQQVEPWFPVAY